MLAASDLSWCVRGAFAIGIVGALIFFVGVPSILAPMPIFLVLLAWAISFLAVLVLPTIYFLSAYFGARLRKYPAFVLALVVLVAGLNVWYFTEAWSYGVKWQGDTYTYTVAILNAVSLGIVGVIAALGAWQNSTKQAKIAHLCLFVILSWCAFPYLGELP